MYVDKDKSGNISIMEISPGDVKDIGSILFEFECIVKSSNIPVREQARLVMVSAKLRFQIIDALCSYLEL